jgi:tetratricopeptide (TPR) repeat protein
MLQAALQASPQASSARVEALIGSFVVRMRWTGAGPGDPEPTQALRAARALGEPLVLARAAFFVGMQARAAGEPGPARASFLAAASGARAAGLVLAQASAVHALACVAWSDGQLGSARRRLREALALARQGQGDSAAGAFWPGMIGPAGPGWWLDVPHLVSEEPVTPLRESQGLAAVATVRASMGSLARADGDYDTASGLLEEALALFDEAGDEDGIALAFGRLGNLAVAAGQPAPAAEYLDRSLAMRRLLADPRGTGIALLGLGRLALATGRLDDAADRYGEALDCFRASGDRPAVVLALTRLGELALARHRDRAARNGSARPPRPPAEHGADPGAEAVRRLEGATAMLRELAHGPLLGTGLTVLAEAYAAVADHGRAADTAAEAITLLDAAPPEPGRDDALRRLGALAGTHGGPGTDIRP